jgi:hypothetical protein
MALAYLERNLAWSSLVAVPSVLVLERISGSALGHAIGIERQELVSMEVEDAILSIQIQEGVTDARFGQEVVKALHVRVVLQLLFVLDVHDIQHRQPVLSRFLLPAELNQNRHKASHCRIAEDVEDAVVEALDHERALGAYVKSFAQLVEAIGLVSPWKPAFSNAFGLGDDFTELDFVLVVGFRRSFSFFRHLYLLFFARCLQLLLLAATLAALVVIVVVVDIALLYCRAPFPG